MASGDPPPQRFPSVLLFFFNGYKKQSQRHRCPHLPRVMGRLPILPMVHRPPHLGIRTPRYRAKPPPPPTVTAGPFGVSGEIGEGARPGQSPGGRPGGRAGSGGAGKEAPGPPGCAPKPGQQAEEGASLPAFQPLLCSAGRLPSEEAPAAPGPEPDPARTEGLRTPMAPRRLALAALLGCWLWAAGGLAQGPLGEEEEDGALVSAPPELLEKLPAAAKATVAAGYVNPSEAEAEATKELPLVPATPPGTRLAGSTAHEAVLIVGDTRYAWQEWSAWHCNCAAGSMARVRDITYALPDVRLDPAQYDLLRFERVVCSYAVCACNRHKHQCDLLAPRCELGQMHLCALRDIQSDQDDKRRHFWAQVNGGLKALWRSLKEAFPSGKKSKAIQVKSSH